MSDSLRHEGLPSYRFRVTPLAWLKVVLKFGVWVTSHIYVITTFSWGYTSLSSTKLYQDGDVTPDSLDFKIATHILTHPRLNCNDRELIHDDKEFDSAL